MAKVYAISGDRIRPLVSGYGGCIAPDTITVDGRRVAFCYRENPDNPIDSGWRFFAGGETDEYLADSRNSGVYDVNTIANYDPDIIPFLDAPAGSAFEREKGVGAFGAVDFDPPAD
ncbi:MAG: DUF2185 domain-containing protein [Caulobacterales bacterium]|nr:DUF2185 domain-containing protein [Caulobacterales bacterium]